jgi:hypothetical protein
MVQRRFELQRRQHPEDRVTIRILTEICETVGAPAILEGSEISGDDCAEEVRHHAPEPDGKRSRQRPESAEGPSNGARQQLRAM